MGDEVWYGTYEDDSCGYSSGQKHLHAQDSVDFANECPAELRALKHRGVQLVSGIVVDVYVFPEARLDVTFVVTTHCSDFDNR